MSELVEATAKAIWMSRCFHAMNMHGIELELWGDGSIPRANGVFDEAKAAISAVKAYLVESRCDTGSAIHTISKALP